MTTTPPYPLTLTLAEFLEAVEIVNAHLDSAVSPDYQAQPLAHTMARVTKACEEAGEIWKAFSKWTGENPRKGVCGTRDELLGEMGDTASAAICGIQHLTGDITATWAVVSAALIKARQRVEEHTASRRCDNRSVGVIITDGNYRYLMFERATFPPGVAPVAGHVDDHGDWESAARAEVTEEVGLTVTDLTVVAAGWRDNTCRREPGPRGVGHDWRVYLATVTGNLNPSQRETRRARWVEHHEIKILTDRTAEYAAGFLTDAEFAVRPGIEPVWVRWLLRAGILDGSRYDLRAIEQRAAQRGGR